MTPQDPRHRRRRSARGWLRALGPGFITGASDDDPSGIGTYAQTGAQFGYTQLWTALFTLPFMIAVQEMCGRIGLVTGKGLAGVIRKYYSKRILWVALTLLLVANTINIGADLGAMAASLQLIIGLPFPVLILAMTILTLVLEVFVSYKTYANVLKYFALTLLAYVLTGLLTRQDWSMVLLHTFIPHFSFNREQIQNIVALLGTTISPYLFFWQAGEEVEEEVAEGRLRVMGRGKPRFGVGDIRTMQNDTVAGMVFSNLITFFIIVTAASTLYRSGVTQIDTAAQTAEALRPLAGNATSVLFALGVIGTGLLAVPVLAGSASYALSEALGWRREGLYRTFAQAHGFYGIITIATLAGLAINFTNVPPFRFLYDTAMLNGIVAPPLIILILLIARNRRIMGQYVNSRLSTVLGIAIAAIMVLCAVLMFVL
ncbi:divalent metal cation transporter [Candidatus Peregrinibacteria bacterium]|nr:divalent metal cation transporter [Candidatus Peregrinibacteria bacterium]